MFFIDNLKNNFDFFLRNHLIFSRKNYNEKYIDLNNYVLTEEHNKICNYFRENYDFNLLKETSEKNFFLNIYLLSVFEKFLTKKTDKAVSILDIGSKNWNYVKSEYVFLNRLQKR